MEQSVGLGTVQSPASEILQDLMPQMYPELHRIASSLMHRERANHTLQPTALISELYLLLVGQRSLDFRNRAQVLGVASQMMRRILLNHFHENASKRGGDLDNGYPREIHFAQGSDGNRHETLEFITYVFDQAGQLVNSAGNSIKTTVTPAEHTQFLQTGVPFHQEVSVPAKGEFSLRIAMHDVEANLVGAVELPVYSVSGLQPLTAAK